MYDKIGQGSCNFLSFILLEVFSLWKMQRTLGRLYNLENGWRCLGMELQSCSYSRCERN